MSSLASHRKLERFLRRGHWIPAFANIGCMRLKKILACSGMVILAIPLLGYAIFVLPLPPERTLRSEVSPDGTRTATYSWRACGVWGALSNNGAYLYMTIRDRATDAVIERHTAFAEPSEVAEVVFADEKPW